MIEDGFSADLIDTSKPHSARMYDWFLGGKDHYPVDATAARKVMELFPHIKGSAWANREFMHRAARYLSEKGVAQFLDIGTGIPTPPNLHQVVQQITPGARVVYTDNDPIVLRHAQALLRGTPEGHVAYLHADVREPELILAHAQKHLDFTQPVGLSLIAVMHFVTDEEGAHQIVRKLLDPLVPGSYLMFSHFVLEDPDLMQRLQDIYRAGGTSVQGRSIEGVTAFFQGLQLCDPGVVLAAQWHPDGRTPAREAPGLYVGVAQKV
ncbi:SAM-dependent methyltransferase [Streptomyces roseirectus]|uniref:SAM-dependent methyltransferase n=1 Tax=Streptomyces roseirectus TaxID=2768066 RepID=UPI001FE779B0|nr:SAM-dependent methyltransferase [Streptomyces roseirectus]